MSHPTTDPPPSIGPTSSPTTTMMSCDLFIQGLPSEVTEATIAAALFEEKLIVKLVYISRPSLVARAQVIYKAGMVEPSYLTSITILGVHCNVRPFVIQSTLPGTVGSLIDLEIRDIPSAYSEVEVKSLLEQFGLLSEELKVTRNSNDFGFVTRYLDYADSVEAARSFELPGHNGAPVTFMVRVRFTMGTATVPETVKRSHTVYVTNVPPSIPLEVLHEALTNAIPCDASLGVMRNTKIQLLRYDWYVKSKLLMVRFSNDVHGRVCAKGWHGLHLPGDYNATLTAQYESEYVELRVFHLNPNITSAGVIEECVKLGTSPDNILHVTEPKRSMCTITLKTHRAAEELHTRLLSGYTDMSRLVAPNCVLDVNPRLLSTKNARKLMRGHTIVIHNVAVDKFTAKSLADLCERYCKTEYGEGVVKAVPRPPYAFVTFRRIAGARRAMKGLELEHGLRVSVARHREASSMLDGSSSSGEGR